MSIRPALRKDRAAIKKLIAAFPRELVQEHLPKTNEFFVADDKGAIVGCCALEIYSKKIAEIRSLAVSDQYQGKGIATKLVNKCVARAKSRGVSQVLAITHNLRFFEKFGFGTFNQEKYATFKYLK